MLCWARYLFVAIVVVLGAGSIVTACGQKGDLYLPERPEQRVSPPEPGDDVPAASDAAVER